MATWFVVSISDVDESYACSTNQILFFKEEKEAVERYNVIINSIITEEDLILLHMEVKQGERDAFAKIGGERAVPKVMQIHLTTINLED